MRKPRTSAPRRCGRRRPRPHRLRRQPDASSADSGSSEDSGPTAAEKLYAEIGALTGQARRDQLVELAAKEGGLDLYTSMTGDVADVVTGAFSDAFDIDVEPLPGRIGDRATADPAGAGGRLPGQRRRRDQRHRARALNKEGVLAEYDGERPRAGAGGRPVRGLDGDPVQPVRARAGTPTSISGRTAKDLGGPGRPASGTASCPWSSATTTGTSRSRLLEGAGQERGGDRQDLRRHGRRRQDRQGPHGHGRAALGRPVRGGRVQLHLHRGGGEGQGRPGRVPAARRARDRAAQRRRPDEDREATRPRRCCSWTGCCEEGQEVLADEGLTPAIVEGNDPLRASRSSRRRGEGARGGREWSKKYEEVLPGVEKVKR